MDFFAADGANDACTGSWAYSGMRRSFVTAVNKQNRGEVSGDDIYVFWATSMGNSRRTFIPLPNEGGGVVKTNENRSPRPFSRSTR
jgi:hypothetical protein